MVRHRSKHSRGPDGLKQQKTEVTGNSVARGFRWDVVGAVAGVGALVVAVATLIAVYDAPNRAGAFERPDLRLSLGSFELTPNEQPTVFIGIESPVPKVELTDLPLRIANLGGKTQKDTTILESIPAVLKNRDIDEFLTVDVRGPPVATVDRSVTYLGSLAIASYKIPVLNPGVPVMWHEPFLLYSSAPHTFTTNVRAKTADNVDVVVPVTTTLSLAPTINVSVLGEDQRVTSYPIAIRGIVGDDENAMKRNIERYLDESGTLQREKMDFWSYLRLLISGKRTEYYILINDTKLFGSAPDQLRQPVSTKVLSKITGPEASWRLLLHRKTG